MPTVPRVLSAAAVLTLLLAAPVAAQTMAPQAILSAAATGALETALGGTLHDGLDLAFRPYFFPSFGDGTLVMMGFRTSTDGLMYGVDGATVGSGEVARMEVFGAILRDGVETRRFGASFALGKSTGFSATHSIGDTLAPGTYEVVWGLHAEFGGKIGSRRETIVVPDFSGGLQLSSVLFAEGNPQAAAGQFQPNTVYPGVRVLTASFADNVGSAYSLPVPPLMLVYLVAGAQPDAATQNFNLELNYRILDPEGNSIWRVAPQTLNRPTPTVGQPIPMDQITGLEPGREYRFEIVARDLVAGTETSREVPFRIEG